MEEREYFTSYIGPDEIMHANFKYLRKYKSKSGKWVYVYENAKNKVRESIGLNAKRDVSTAKKYMDGLKNQKNTAFRNATMYPKNLSPSQRRDTAGVAAKRNQLGNAAVKADSNYKKAKQGYEAALARYSKTPIGRMSSLVEAGRKLLARLTK